MDNLLNLIVISKVTFLFTNKTLINKILIKIILKKLKRKKKGNFFFFIKYIIIQNLLKKINFWREYKKVFF